MKHINLENLPTDDPNVYYIFVDGSCNNLARPAWGGFVAVWTKNPMPDIHEVYAMRSGFVHNATNNIAEYSALLAGLRLIKDHIWDRSYHFVYIFSDSELVIKQMTHIYQCKDPTLQKYYYSAQNLVQELKDLGIDIDLRWIPRQLNKVADYYSKKMNPYFNKALAHEQS